MNVFISWSGDRSKHVAEALRYWLKQVINVLDPWISVADVGSGTRWRDLVASKLKESDIGIICLTPENLRSEWLLFEAGALSKAIETAYVCPLLIDLEPSDVTGPLAQFQATRANREEIRELVLTINSALGQKARLEQELTEAFEVWWPKLEDKMKPLVGVGPVSPKRGDREILEEVLAIVREQSRSAISNPIAERREITAEKLNSFETDLRDALEKLPGLYRAKVRSHLDSYRIEVDLDPSIGANSKAFEFRWDDEPLNSTGQRAIEKVSTYLDQIMAEHQIEESLFGIQDGSEMARFRAELLNELTRRNVLFAADVVKNCRIEGEENRVTFFGTRGQLFALKDRSFENVARRVYKELFGNTVVIHLKPGSVSATSVRES